MARKLEAYRARRPQSARIPAFSRDNLRSHKPALRRRSQQTLPFSAEPRPAELGHLRDGALAGDLARVPTRERMEIVAYQPELDFSAVNDSARPESAAIPVAPLAVRLRAGLLDAGFLLLTYAAFIGVFAALGGHLSLGKLDAAIYAATFLLFYAQYFALFTAFGGATPGMQLCGLYAVGFDGTPATNRQLLWRSFGYVIAGGAALLGFLWSLWDEDQLTWHDRISQTYIAQMPAEAETEES